jgi:RND family efflux transporter MFP subunit
MRTSRTHLVFALALATAALGVSAGCKGKERQAAMPPATGQGAKPLPTLPKVPNPDEAGGGAGSVGASEGKATGTLYPKSEVNVGPKAGGLISQVLVKEGDRVKKGQVLFRTDASDIVLHRNQAKVALDGANVQLNAAKVEYDRAKTLVDQNAMNRAQWDQVQTAYEAAKVQVQGAQATLALASKSVADTTVVSPLDGVVLKKLMDAGEMATTMPPSVVLVLQDQKHLELRFPMTESTLKTIKVGDEVTADFTAVGLKRVLEISRIDSTIDLRTRTVMLVADVDNADYALRPGYLAEVTVGSAPAAAAPAPAAPTEVGEAEKPAPAAEKPAPAPAEKPVPASAPVQAGKGVGSSAGGTR